tara:strand:- start:66 stop:338 length:273 start_codon:yes stop_codon:yes gene_type:complete
MRQGLKHGTYKKVPTPHADISKYVEKDSSKSPEHFRKEDSELKTKGKAASRRAMAQQKPTIVLEKFKKGGRVTRKRSTGVATHGFGKEIR